MRSLTKYRVLILACIPALLSATSVYSQNSSWHAGGASAPSASAPKGNELPVIKQILGHQERFRDREIRVRGVFRGWKGTCPASSTITRSDWMLEDETGCIYVTGRIPATLSPARPKGERVLVTGRVIATKKGLPVIKAVRIILLPN